MTGPSHGKDQFKGRVASTSRLAALTLAAVGSVLVFGGYSSAPLSLSGRLRVVEQNWPGPTGAGLRLTRAHGPAAKDAEAAPVFMPAGAVVWDVPALGRISVGRTVTTSLPEGGSREHVVTEISALEGPAGPILSKTSEVERLLVLTLRPVAHGGNAAAPMQVLVTGTPAAGAAHAPGSSGANRTL